MTKKKINVKLTHIGEILVKEILIDSEAVVKLVCPNIFLSASPNYTVETELKLKPYGTLNFDGAHGIDVAILDHNTRKCYPLELKFGKSRLAKGEFERRFLRGCRVTNNGGRIAGSMISILEQKFSKECGNFPLEVEHEGDPYTVSDKWTLICLKIIFDGWEKRGEPELKKCNQVFLEDLVQEFGGKKRFNALVKTILKGDYYSEWLGDS